MQVLNLIPDDEYFIDRGYTMIMGAKTIAQFKILKWIDKNFERGSVEVVFDQEDQAAITGPAGGSMRVTYSLNEGIKWEVLS